MNEEKKPSAIEILNLFSMNQYKQYPECYRRYLENMPEFYMEDLMDYIVSSPEEDVTNSDYIFEEEDISSSILNIDKYSTNLLLYKKGKLLNKISIPIGTNQIEKEIKCCTAVRQHSFNCCPLNFMTFR